MNGWLDANDSDTENSGPKKPPGAEAAEVEELLSGVRGVAAGGVAVVDKGVAVDETACVLSCTVEISIVGRVTGTTKGMPVSAACTPAGVDGVFIAGGVSAEYAAW